jgi:hypothetical protein
LKDFGKADTAHSLACTPYHQRAIDNSRTASQRARQPIYARFGMSSAILMVSSLVCARAYVGKAPLLATTQGREKSPKHL